MGLWRRPRRADRLKLHIIARGKIGRCPEADLIDRYAKRMTWPFQVSELPDTGGKAVPIGPNTRIIALDEGGEQISSMELARLLERWRDDGVRETRLLIGAADGLTREERMSADWAISFGKVTWPHMMVRAMLAEQLYRATSIIAGHPYHREG